MGTYAYKGTNMSRITLSAGDIVEIFASASISPGSNLVITTVNVGVTISKTNTFDDIEQIAPMSTVYMSDSIPELYVQSGQNCQIDVHVETLLAQQFNPNGLYSGLRAVNVQTYTESNSKLGLQHEGSTLLTDVPSLAKNDTIFLTGALPVSLKGRIIGFTGVGVIAEIFETPTYTGGVSAPYQNASAINPVAGLSEIIVGANVTADGVLKFAPDHLIGNLSNQGKGTASTVVGQEKILKPDTAYLFRLTSLDTQPQDIASLLTWYEGELDLPLLQ